MSKRTAAYFPNQFLLLGLLLCQNAYELLLLLSLYWLFVNKSSGHGDVGLATDIGRGKNVLDTDSLGYYGKHPLALSTTVIRSIGKSVLFGQAGLRKEDAYGLVPCERSSHVDLVVSTTNRGVLCIPEEQLALYDCVVQKYGPIYGNTLHKSLAYFVNLFVRQLMAVISAVNSCCIKTPSEAVLEEWDAVVATSLNLGFTVGWLQDYLFKLRAMWKRDRVLYCMQMEYSEASEKFDSLQARATLLRKFSLVGRRLLQIWENYLLCHLS